MIRSVSVERLLASPGRDRARRNVRLDIGDGRITGIGDAVVARSGTGLALPAMVNAHDHGYGVRPPALGGADDALECWIASFSRITIEPRLEAAVAFGRMALAGIGATVHCHNSLVEEERFERVVRNSGDRDARNSAPIAAKRYAKK